MLWPMDYFNLVSNMNDVKQNEQVCFVIGCGGGDGEGDKIL